MHYAYLGLGTADDDVHLRPGVHWDHRMRSTPFGSVQSEQKSIYL